MKTLIAIILFVGFGLGCTAQKMELGLWAGLSYYSGDLTPPEKPFLESRLGLGISYQYHFSPLISFRANYNWAQLAGNDRHATEESGRRGRNLHFRSDIHELSAVACFSPMGLWAAKQKKPFPTIYILTGIAAFHFNPQAKFEGEWVDLQPLGTEGQGIEEYSDQKKYSRLQLSIPFGGGIRFPVAPCINVSFEMAFRKTFTDYIDDVSTVYAPVELLREHNGDLSAELSNLTYNKEGNQVDLSGQVRGGKSKDAYIFLGVRFNYCIFREKQYKASLHKWM